MTLSRIFQDAQKFFPGPRQYSYIIEHGAEVLAHDSLSIWSIHDLPARPETGNFVLICVAVYSLPDMELLDAVVAKQRESKYREERLDIVNVLTCSQTDFDSRIPGIGKVFQTPVVGIWKYGVLEKKGSGHKAVEAIKQHYSLDITDC